MAVKKVVDRSVEEETVTIDRRRDDRRKLEAAAADSGSAKTPRRRKQRRRHIDPTTCERDYNDQEIEFMRAMDDYKHASGRMFPTCSEVLEVVRKLGYIQLTEDQIEEFGLDICESEAIDTFSSEESDEELAEV